MISPAVEIPKHRDQLLVSTTRIPKRSDKPILTSDGFPVGIVAYHRPSRASAKSWHSTSHAAPVFHRPQAAQATSRISDDEHHPVEISVKIRDHSTSKRRKMG